MTTADCHLSEVLFAVKCCEQVRPGIAYRTSRSNGTPVQCSVDFAATPAATHLLLHVLAVGELTSVHLHCSGDQGTVPAKKGIAELDDAQIRPRPWTYAQNLFEDRRARYVRTSLRKDEGHGRGRAGNASMAMDKEMCARLQMTPKGKKFPHMLRLRRYYFVAMLLDDVVKTKLEFRMLTEGTERLWNRPLRIQYRKNVTDANLAMPRQLFQTADGDAEGHKARC
jgi:hypothetical protein